MHLVEFPLWVNLTRNVQLVPRTRVTEASNLFPLYSMTWTEKHIAYLCSSWRTVVVRYKVTFSSGLYFLRQLLLLNSQNTIYCLPQKKRVYCESVQITNKLQTCNQIYYSKIYWRLNMFRAAYRSYQELQTVLAASGLYIHVVTGCCPRWMGSHPAWWAVCRSKHVELSINFGIINSITRLHLVGYFYWFIMIRLFIFLLNFEKCVLNSNTPAYVVNCICLYIFLIIIGIYPGAWRT